MMARIPGLWRLSAAARRMRGGLTWLLSRSGALVVWRCRPGRRPVILMYHSVGGDGISPDIWVSAAHFRDHLRYLARRYRPVTLHAIVAAMRDGASLPPDAVAVTFDDGYRDNDEIALPILREFDCPAAVFVTVEPVDSGRLLWPQRLWTWLYHTDAARLQFEWSSADGKRFAGDFPLRTDSHRDEARMQLRAFAGALDPVERELFLAELATRLPPSVAHPPFGGRTIATWDQLRHLRDNGVTIGAHTITHSRLFAADSVTLHSELHDARARLQRELDRDIDLFAYPFGVYGKDFDEATMAAARDAGYAAACAVEAPERLWADLFALPRLYLPDDPDWRFAVRLELGAKESRFLRWLLRD